MIGTPTRAPLGQRRAWWKAAALASAVAAMLLPVAARALTGPPGARVHVRWAPSIDEATRQELERGFRLVDGTTLGGTTWAYDLLDPSTDNIRALVSHPSVADTHEIDRPRFLIAQTAERTDRRLRLAFGSAVVWTADRLALLLGIAAAVFISLGVSGRADTPAAARRLLHGWFLTIRRTAHAMASPLAGALSRGIPPIEASTAGMFRIIFGSALILFFSARPIDAARFDTIFDPQIDGEMHAVVFRWLQDHPVVANLLMPWLFTTAVAVTIGLYTRIAYALLVAGAVLWAYAAVAVDNTHPHSTLILTMIALLPSKWGDALSVDAWLRQRRGRVLEQQASKRYGYSVWVPGLVFGVAFAAAAWAKVAPNGTAWILNGTVKYHFITDSGNAVVDWGVRLATHPVLAIVASLVAVGVEALVVTAAFSRSQSYRFLMGLSAAGLLAGFWLFMGVFWPGWWILLLGFLPWQQLDRLKAPSVGARSAVMEAMTPAQAGLVLAIIGQQVLISALAIERAPVFSNYPMYSTTYASPAAFNASRPPSYRIVVVTDSDRVTLSCNPTREMVEEFRAAVQGSPTAAASVWRAVRACRPDLVGAREITIEESRPLFDWDALKYSRVDPTIVGTLPLHQRQPG